MNETIKIAGVQEESIVDGPGIRYTIFTQGCPHRCLNCHNIETWDFDSGTKLEMSQIIKEIRKNPLIDGITLSGGEPLAQPEKCVLLLKKVKELGLNTLVYSGYTFEEIVANESFKKVLDYTDILIDGPYIDNKRDLTLRFRGSSNQRIIDVPESLLNNEVVLKVLGE